jgi:hypothetical protein
MKGFSGGAAFGAGTPGGGGGWGYHIKSASSALGVGTKAPLGVGSYYHTSQKGVQHKKTFWPIISPLPLSPVYHCLPVTG